MPARYCSRRLRSWLICASVSHGARSDALAGVGREQLDRRVEADLAQRLRDLRVLRALRACASISSTSIFDRLDLADQHEVVALAVVRVAADDAVRERLEERRRSRSSPPPSLLS